MSSLLDLLLLPPMGKRTCFFNQSSPFIQYRKQSFKNKLDIQYVKHISNNLDSWDVEVTFVVVELNWSLFDYTKNHKTSSKTQIWKIIKHDPRTFFESINIFQLLSNLIINAQNIKSLLCLGIHFLTFQQSIFSKTRRSNTSYFYACFYYNNSHIVGATQPSQF